MQVLIDPMNNPLGVSPSKGNRGTTWGKEKTFDRGGNQTHDLRIRSTVTLPTELRGQTEKVRGDLGGISRWVVNRWWMLWCVALRTQMVEQRINSEM